MDLLCNCLQEIGEWCRTNSLKLNDHKTDVIVFGTTRIQNMAARVITFTPRRDHITPVLKDLHWLPVKCRIEYKILLHVYRCLNGTAPLYLANLLNRQSPGRTRSSEQHLLDIPRTKLASFGDRSFRVVGPRLWNALPIDIKYCRTLSAFRKALKTHIFKAYYC